MEFDTREYWDMEYNRHQEQQQQREYEEHCLRCCHLAEEWLLGNITDETAESYFSDMDDSLISWAEFIIDGA